VEHDSDQIHQVLLNLLLNAVQAIEARGAVGVEIASRDHFAVVTVTDNGRGIPPRYCLISSGLSSQQKEMAPGSGSRWRAELWKSTVDGSK
jgi:phosphoglycerate-specific signal transduction histidine kinase